MISGQWSVLGLLTRYVFFFFVITEHIVLNKKVYLFLFFFLIGIFCVRLLGSREEKFDQAIQDGKRQQKVQMII